METTFKACSSVLRMGETCLLESLMKKFLGDNVEGTLDLMKEEEVDEEAFLNLDCSHLKEMG